MNHENKSNLDGGSVAPGQISVNAKVSVTFELTKRVFKFTVKLKEVQLCANQS